MKRAESTKPAAPVKKEITEEQMLHLMHLLPLLDEARPNLSKLICSSQKASQFLTPGLAWGQVYDMTINEQLANFFVVAGLVEPIVAAASSPDPISELFKLDNSEGLPDWNGGKSGAFKPSQLLGSCFALLGSLECLVLYGHYINELVALSFDHGDDEALFKAIRVDPIVVTSTKAAHRISVAVVQGQHDFIRGLQNALKGKTGKQARYLKKFRFLMQLLLEAGSLDQPSRDIRFLALKLGAYADDPSAEKNLNEQIRKFRRKKTISN